MTKKGLIILYGQNKYRRVTKDHSYAKIVASPPTRTPEEPEPTTEPEEPQVKLI